MDKAPQTIRYALGSLAFRAAFDSQEAWVQCPDCCGSGRLRVIMGDETVVSIDCQNCTLGYLGPQGRLRVYQRTPRAELVTITGVEMSAEGIEYRTSTSYIVDESDLFDNEHEAVAAAQAKADQLAAEELRKIATKEKDTQSWARNASYHRKCIKRAQEELAYHTSKLAVAALKAKELAHG